MVVIFKEVPLAILNKLIKQFKTTQNNKIYSDYLRGINKKWENHIIIFVKATFIIVNSYSQRIITPN